jgi:hypothetical protein
MCLSPPLSLSNNTLADQGEWQGYSKISFYCINKLFIIF